jgi:UTP--glucose-1-phosphate uridylyltransferase
LAHALLSAREFCDGNPFAVLLPDDLVESPELPLLQMIGLSDSLGGAIFAATQESAENVKLYGRLQLHQLSEQLDKVEAILGRSASLDAKSALAGVGRYLLSPQVLEYTATPWNQPRIGEFDDTMILQHMIAVGEPVHAIHIEGRRYDISTPQGYGAA